MLPRHVIRGWPGPVRCRCFLDTLLENFAAGVERGESPRLIVLDSCRIPIIWGDYSLRPCLRHERGLDYPRAFGAPERGCGQIISRGHFSYRHLSGRQSRYFSAEIKEGRGLIFGVSRMKQPSPSIKLILIFRPVWWLAVRARESGPWCASSAMC